MSTEQDITHNIQAINPNLDKLKQGFPHCFDKNGDFDFAKFKAELDSSDINIAKEGYSLNWLGKSYARVLASDAATTLLKEDEVHNAKPENANSQNVLIKGDNLEVLKHLSNAYYEKVKMIYIDPPYNTGSDGFVYNDDRKFTAKQLQDLAGVTEDEAKRILEFTQSNSNSHSAWLTFMYPRLYIAKQLLKDDGVIFVSIDDNEVAQLRLLMDEVFGEENFRNQIAVRRGAKSVQAQFETIDKLGIGYEHILLYSKNSEFRLPQFYFELDESKSGSWNNHWRGTDRPSMRYEILGCNIEKGQWRWSKERSLMAINNYKRLIADLKTNNPTNEQIDKWYSNNENLDLLRLSNTGRPEHYVPSSSTKFGNNLWTDLQIGSSNSLKKLELEYFENPKNPDIIKRAIKWITKTNDLILDFFAGSGTTAHSVMQLNAEDGGNRKFILVQLPELIDAKKSKAAYDFVESLILSDESLVSNGTQNSKLSTKNSKAPTIFEITKERIIRAAKQIGETSGFKIFETTPIWEDYDFKAEKLANAEKLFDDDKLTEADVKALFTTWKTYDGSPLTEPVQEVDLAGYKAYYTKQKLYLMHKGFSTATLKALLEQIDADANFNPTAIIAFGYYFESKALREIAENIKTYNNKKNIDIDFITRY